MEDLVKFLVRQIAAANGLKILRLKCNFCCSYPFDVPVTESFLSEQLLRERRVIEIEDRALDNTPARIAQPPNMNIKDTFGEESNDSLLMAGRNCPQLSVNREQAVEPEPA